MFRNFSTSGYTRNFQGHRKSSKKSIKIYKSLQKIGKDMLLLSRQSEYYRVNSEET